MELFFFIILGIIVLGIFGDGKKQKSKPKASSILLPKGGRRTSGPAVSVWENYEAAEQVPQSGMQDDLDPSALYKISKERVERASKAAASKLSYSGLPNTKDKSKPSGSNLQSFETTAKNAQMQGGYVAKQPPLVRDMNVSRKLFLSGGRGNTFGERQKNVFGFKSIMGVVGLGVVAVYLIGALSS